MRILFCAALLALAAGCTQVEKLAASDAANAAAMAQADASDPQAASRLSCYRSWAGLAGGAASAPAGTGGIFTMVETGIEVQSTLNSPPCQQIAGQVLLWTLHKLPGGNLLP